MVAVLAVSTAILQARTLNVFAAASLKEAFTQISRDYESAHPGLTIRLSFAGSQTLAAQINQGAPADVFASAAERNLDDIQFDKGSHRLFVKNKLEIAVRLGLPGVRSVRDLSRVRNLVVADPAVPVGSYTDAFFNRAAGAYGSAWLAKIRAHIVSREQDVKAVLAKVELGEADAGIVYVSDAATAKGKVVAVPIPESQNQMVSYPVAIPSESKNKDDAKHFIKFLLSGESQRIFEHTGFVSQTRPTALLVVVKRLPGDRVRFPIERVPLPLPAKYPSTTVEAVDEQKRSIQFNGVLAASLPWVSDSSTATFIGADGYSQTISTAELKSRKAVLVRGSDGNYQLIVPGLKPSVWVNWLRRIELR